MTDNVECIELPSSDDDSSILEIIAPQKAAPSVGDNDSDSDDSLLHGAPMFSASNVAADAAHRSAKASAAASQQRQNSPPKKQKLTREERDEQRRRDREKREEQKRLDKLQREAERNRKRAEKENAKRVEQESKRRRILAAQQTSGKFAPQEIAILMEPRLLQTLEPIFLQELQETYAIHPHAHTQEGTIQWIRKDFTAGGAHDAIQALDDGNVNAYQRLNRTAIVFHDSTKFIQMLYRSDDHDDYPLLESWLDSLQYSGKLVLLLHQVTEELDKQWNAHRRARQDPPPPTDSELSDAIVWLLIQFQVECIICPSEEVVIQKIQKMTRALSEEPYQQQVTELECIKKLKTECSSDSCSAYEKANDTWIRQLQQIPRVSDAMARNVAQYFPTARSLWNAYQDSSRSEEDKRMLLAPLFTEGRQQTKLSDTVYRLLTSSNPNEFL